MVIRVCKTCGITFECSGWCKDDDEKCWCERCEPFAKGDIDVFNKCKIHSIKERIVFT